MFQIGNYGNPQGFRNMGVPGGSAMGGGMPGAGTQGMGSPMGMGGNPYQQQMIQYLQQQAGGAQGGMPQSPSMGAMPRFPLQPGAQNPFQQQLIQHLGQQAGGAQTQPGMPAQPPGMAFLNQNAGLSPQAMAQNVGAGVLGRPGMGMPAQPQAPNMGQVMPQAPQTPSMGRVQGPIGVGGGVTGGASQGPMMKAQVMPQGGAQMSAMSMARPMGRM